MTRRILVAAAALLAVLAIPLAIAMSVNGRVRPVPGPAATGPIVAFYGDSYTLGTGASAVNKRWSTAISAQRNWREVNPSVNGLGFVNNRSPAIDEPAEIIAARPDIVFITMGLNDNFSYDRAAAQIRRQIGVDLSRLKGALPKARFIVVEPFWYTDERPKSLAVISGWVKAAASDIRADYIPGASRWIEGHPEWMAADGLHPNDAGYAEMARRMNAELKKLGL
ncbi:MAG: SGNH/GDSL hydrolase family protein [Actinomycetota bacterium]